MLDKLGFRAVELLLKGSFEPIGISMLLRAIAVLQYKNRLLLTTCVEVMLGQLEQWEPRGVASMVWATAKLKFHNTALLKRSLAYYTAHMADFRPQEVCNLLWGLTSLRYAAPHCRGEGQGRRELKVEGGQGQGLRMRGAEG